MQERYGHYSGCVIILHGGAGPQDPSAEGIAKANRALNHIAKKAYKKILLKLKPIEVVSFCLKQLENDPQFNAGIGSALQSDGIPRLSASIMDGKKQSFSGVLSASYVPNPSILAEALQLRRAKVLSPPGTELLARELNLPIHSNLTENRSKKWLKNMQMSNYPASYDQCDTVGCVIKFPGGYCMAGSSTGGRGHEYPGRVGDTATVAGNYASKYAAIAVTGQGEQITDDGIAVRLETRIRDGMELREASGKTFQEAIKRKRRYGWILCDRYGNWGIVHTTKFLPCVVYGNNKLLYEFSP